MEIRRNKVVALDYTLKDDAGNVIDKSGKTPLYYLHGHSNIISGLEEALEGRSPGDSFEVSLPPEKGYGKHDPKLVSSLPISRLPEGSRPMKGQKYNVQVGNQMRQAETVLEALQQERAIADRVRAAVVSLREEDAS